MSAFDLAEVARMPLYMCNCTYSVFFEDLVIWTKGQGGWITYRSGCVWELLANTNKPMQGKNSLTRAPQVRLFQSPFLGLRRHCTCTSKRWGSAKCPQFRYSIQNMPNKPNIDLIYINISSCPGEGWKGDVVYFLTIRGLRALKSYLRDFSWLGEVTRQGTSPQYQ